MSARDALHARLYKGRNENRDDLLDAFRAEVLAEAAAVADRFTERWPDMDAMKADGIIGPFTAFGRIADELRKMAGKDTGGAPAGESTQPAPDFFQPSRTYTRQHHGDTIEFYVDHLSTAPGSTNPTAFGWRRAPGGEWEPTDSDDTDGWTATGAAATETCGQCRRPFDEADTRWDGRSRYGDTPFCRACVDRCHDTEIADHRCLVCTKGGDPR